MPSAVLPHNSFSDSDSKCVALSGDVANVASAWLPKCPVPRSVRCTSIVFVTHRIHMGSCRVAAALSRDKGLPAIHEDAT